MAWGAGTTRIREFEFVTGQQFRNDINVLVKVAVSYHQIYGLQISVQDIDVSFTIGRLEQQKQETLLKLLAENPDTIQKIGEKYYTKNNRLPLNQVIQKLAVISSNNSAGYQDFVHTLENNPFGYQFTTHNYFTAVQGETNAEGILQRLIDIFNAGIAYDAVIIIRGGGAQTDFLLFDTYRLGRAVARFPIPVITGIGHQKNETIVDLMAHSPTKTPTKAAEFIIAHNHAFEEKVINLQKTVLIKSQQLFSTHFQALSALNTAIINQARTMIATHKDELTGYNQVVINEARAILYSRQRELLAVSGQVLSKPKIMVANRRNDLQNLVGNLQAFSRIYFQKKQAYIAHHETVFRLVSPANILKRGFAIVYHNGKVTASPDAITPGSNIKVLLTDTEINATVTSKNTTDGTEFNI